MPRLRIPFAVALLASLWLPSCTDNLSEPVEPVESYGLEPDTLTVRVGEAKGVAMILFVDGVREGFSRDFVSWESSAPGIASVPTDVTQVVNVTGVAVGTATITASSQYIDGIEEEGLFYGEIFTATATVTVIPADDAQGGNTSSSDGGAGGVGGAPTSSSSAGGAGGTAGAGGAGGTGGVDGPTCSDGIKNDTETDVDCGGAICSGCSLGNTCLINADCGEGLCDAGTCADVKIVFASSVLYTGNMGGLAGADALCAGLASGVLPGTFKAYLSTAAEAATARLSHGTGSYKSTSGETVALSDVEFFSAVHLAPIDHDEHGNPIVGPLVWTGTGASGESVSPNCSDWTSADGSVQGSGGLVDFFTFSDWTTNGQAPCDQTRHLYCVQQ